MTPAKPLPLVVPVTSTTLAGLEGLGGDLLAERVLGGVGGADLGDVAARRDAGLLEVARERLGHLARVDGAEGELDGGVAVRLRRAHLGDDVGADLDDGDGDEAARPRPRPGSCPA